MAAVRQVGQRCGHAFQLLDLSVECRDVFHRQLFHVTALARAVLPESQKFSDLFDGETKVASTANVAAC